MLQTFDQESGSCWDWEQRVSQRPAIHPSLLSFASLFLFSQSLQATWRAGLAPQSSWAYFFQSRPIWNLLVQIPNSWKNMSSPDWIHFNKGDQEKGLSVYTQLLRVSGWRKHLKAIMWPIQTSPKVSTSTHKIHCDLGLADFPHIIS